MKDRLRGAASNILLLTGSILLPLLLTEGILQIINKPAKTERLLGIGWRAHVQDRVNQLGFRGRPIKYNDSDIVVLLLGDSQVESVASSPDSMPEVQLERCLQRESPRFKVFSVGAGGYGNDQELLALREYYKTFRADYVLLWQTFGNDVWNNMFPTHMPKDGWRKPTFWLEDGKLKGPDRAMEPLQRSAKWKLQMLWEKLFPINRGMDEYWEKKYLPTAYRPLDLYSGTYTTKYDWKTYPDRMHQDMYREENFENEKAWYSVWLYPRSPRIEYGIKLGHALIAEIEKLCRIKGTRFCLFAIENPDAPYTEKEEPDDIVVQKIGGRYYRFSAVQYWKNSSQMNQGFVFYRIPLTVTDYRVSEWDGHLNPRAVKVEMSLLADSLIKNNFIKLPNKPQ